MRRWAQAVHGDPPRHAFEDRLHLAVALERDHVAGFYPLELAHLRRDRRVAFDPSRRVHHRDLSPPGLSQCDRADGAIHEVPVYGLRGRVADEERRGRLPLIHPACGMLGQRKRDSGRRPNIRLAGVGIHDRRPPTRTDCRARDRRGDRGLTDVHSSKHHHNPGSIKNRLERAGPRGRARLAPGCCRGTRAASRLRWPSPPAFS